MVSFVELRRRCELSAEREVKGGHVMKEDREEKENGVEHGGQGEQRASIA